MLNYAAILFISAFFIDQSLRLVSNIKKGKINKKGLPISLILVLISIIVFVHCGIEIGFYFFIFLYSIPIFSSLLFLKYRKPFFLFLYRILISFNIVSMLLIMLLFLVFIITSLFSDINW